MRACVRVLLCACMCVCVCVHMHAYAAVVLCRVGKYDHITPTLKQLHWLSVKFRIKYKKCLLTFNALNFCGPQYLLEMLTTVMSG